MTLIIDCHGHYTTAPAAHNDWRDLQKAAFRAGEAAPAYPAISDDEIRETLENKLAQNRKLARLARQVRVMRCRMSPSPLRSLWLISLINWSASSPWVKSQPAAAIHLLCAARLWA